MDLSVIQSRLLIAAASAISGVALTIITQRLLAKRGRFTYVVHHERIGLSAEDVVFGSVQVTWSGTPVDNLYLSTVQLTNQSLQDFEGVVVRVFSNDTLLLTERSEIVGSTRVPEVAPDYARQLAVPEGASPTTAQWDLYGHRREYRIPTMNRGQIVRFAFLNTAIGGRSPSIWLDIQHKGVKLEFRRPAVEVLGVPQAQANLAGVLVTVPVAAGLIALAPPTWLAVIASLVYGFIAQLPGVLVIKLARWLRMRLGD